MTPYFKITCIFLFANKLLILIYYVATQQEEVKKTANTLLLAGNTYQKTIANKITNSQITCGNFVYQTTKAVAKVQRRLHYRAKEVCKKVAQPQQNTPPNQIFNSY